MRYSRTQCAECGSSALQMRGLARSAMEEDYGLCKVSPFLEFLRVLANAQPPTPGVRQKGSRIHERKT